MFSCLSLCYLSGLTGCSVHCTCRKGRAEELPFSDSSVDLVTASVAAHWFDHSRFLAEADRVLKPRGCIALVGYTNQNLRLSYQNCGEQLNSFYEEVGVITKIIVLVKCENKDNTTTSKGIQ